MLTGRRSGWKACATLLPDTQLPAVPSGNVKVVIEGRTATVSPAGYYFPEMVMDAQMSPGVNHDVMAGMETMYLPRIPGSILAPISASQTTLVTLRHEAALDLPLAQQRFPHRRSPARQSR